MLFLSLSVTNRVNSQLLLVGSEKKGLKISTQTSQCRIDNRNNKLFVVSLLLVLSQEERRFPFTIISSITHVPNACTLYRKKGWIKICWRKKKSTHNFFVIFLLELFLSHSSYLYHDDNRVSICDALFPNNITCNCYGFQATKICWLPLTLSVKHACLAIHACNSIWQYWTHAFTNRTGTHNITPNMAHIARSISFASGYLRAFRMASPLFPLFSLFQKSRYFDDDLSE